MTQKSKAVKNFREAVQDIPDGATVGFGGFAMPGVPFNLIKALLEHGAKNLTLVANSTGGAQQPRMPDVGMLVENGQVKKVICAFTAATRPTDVIPFTKYYESGEVDAELVPQGTLAERMRAAGAGIPAFYTPTAVGTELAAGRETRVINGREYLLEYALPLDYAFIRATRADTFGNLQFHRSQRNFCPVMATAARIAIAEVDEDIVPAGSIDPDQVHTPGIFVHRVVKVPPPPDGLWPTRRQERRR
ncbi:MAG TPA: CoA transferase subunit A [Acetobacteraceae bacterium]|jgi:3-oxoacid CoA-transferase A subunit|nr:CoA transferase subunit A [Acetobacteraceae bacterium]